MAKEVCSYEQKATHNEDTPRTHLHGVQSSYHPPIIFKSQHIYVARLKSNSNRATKSQATYVSSTHKITHTCECIM